jgi:hypothetical protein
MIRGANAVVITPNVASRHSLGVAWSEIRMVENIEELCAELNALMRGDVSVLENRQIKVLITRSGDGVPPGIADGKQWRQRKRRCVKPSV